jgi:ketosteroid isomerase-like protein
MKKTVFLFIAIATLAAIAPAQKATAKVDPAKAVRAAFDRFIEGIRQVDAVKVMDAYEQSPRLLVFNNNGSATIDYATVKSNTESTYAKLRNVAIDVTGVRVEMLGPAAAYVSCKWTQSQENEGKVETASGRMTLVYKLINKEWKIVHRHTSPDNPGPTRPVMDSERIKTSTP